MIHPNEIEDVIRDVCLVLLCGTETETVHTSLLEDGLSAREAHHIIEAAKLLNRDEKEARPWR